MKIGTFFLLLFLVSNLVTSANAQQMSADKIAAALTRDKCVELEDKLRVCKADYVVKEKAVEAISFQPAGEGRFPGVLLIPGFQRTAFDLISIGVLLARNGFAGLGVTQPGFGKSEGPADYVGAKTLNVLTEGYNKLKREPYVDNHRMGIYGFSRGGMAASLLAVQIKDVRAAVFGAGIYDFKSAHDEAKIEGIRKNMEVESGMTDQAIRDRSSILRMEHLKCPVLILHGEKDENVPVTQAYLLRDRLTVLKKDFEIKLFPDRPHGIGPEVGPLTLDFFKRRLPKSK